MHERDGHNIVGLNLRMRFRVKDSKNGKFILIHSTQIVDDASEKIIIRTGIVMV